MNREAAMPSDLLQRAEGGNLRNALIYKGKEGTTGLPSKLG